jgi:uncharacterized protein YggE
MLKSKVKIAMIKSSLLSLCLLMSFTAVAEQDLRRYIEVTGQATTLSEPDILRFTVNIEEKGESASKLNLSVTEKTEQVVSLLRDKGIERRDIQSMQVNLYPWYERSSQTQIQKGFVFNRTIQIALRDFSVYPELIDGIMRIGVSRVDGFSYEIESADTLYQSTLAQSVKDAEETANQLAKSLDVNLGKVLEVQEISSNSGSPQFARSRSLTGQGNSFLPGLIPTNAKVLVKYSVSN